MKKMLQILVVGILILSLLPCYAAAQSQVESVQAMVDSLLLPGSISDVHDPSYKQVLAQTKDTVYGLADLSDKELVQVVGYEKAFELYIDLIIMQAEDLLPTQEFSTENYQQQTVALEKINDLIYEGEPLFELASYTQKTINSDFYPPETTTGYVALYEFQKKLNQVNEDCNKYLSTLSDEERYKLQKEEYIRVLSQFPETFTQENVWTYAKDFVMLMDEVESWYGKYYFVNETSLEDSIRYEQLAYDYEVAMGIYSDLFMEEIDREIERQFKDVRGGGYSYLRLLLIERPVYDTLAEQIDLLAQVNGARVYNEIKNLSVFEAYERNFWPNVNFFGDINEDYLVNASDALVILQVVVGKAEINYTQWAAGDVDANGQLNAKDALHVLQYAVNLIDWFPAEAELYGILI